jgi:hypothetical protein
MLWILVVTFMGLNNPKIPDGTAIPMARFQAEEACNEAKAALFERKGPPPGEGSTLECKQVKAGETL